MISTFSKYKNYIVFTLLYIFLSNSFNSLRYMIFRPSLDRLFELPHFIMVILAINISLYLFLNKYLSGFAKFITQLYLVSVIFGHFSGLIAIGLVIFTELFYPAFLSIYIYKKRKNVTGSYKYISVLIMLWIWTIVQTVFSMTNNTGENWGPIILIIGLVEFAIGALVVGIGYPIFKRLHRNK